MTVTVKLFATLRVGRGKVLNIDLSGRTTVKDIVEQLEISSADIAILLVNGRTGLPGTALKDGDAISLFPPVGGG